MKQRYIDYVVFLPKLPGETNECPDAVKIKDGIEYIVWHASLIEQRPLRQMGLQVGAYEDANDPRFLMLRFEQDGNGA